MEQILQDKDLTMSEKGLLCFLLSLKKDYKLQKKSLEKLFGNDSLKAITKVFNSLGKKGYIETIKSGLAYEYKVYDLCQKKSFQTVADIINNRWKK